MLAWVLTLCLSNGTTTYSTQRAMDVRDGYKPVTTYERCVELAKEKQEIMNASIEHANELDKVTIVCKRIDAKSYYKNRHKEYATRNAPDPKITAKEKPKKKDKKQKQ